MDVEFSSSPFKKERTNYRDYHQVYKLDDHIVKKNNVYYFFFNYRVFGRMLFSNMFGCELLTID